MFYGFFFFIDDVDDTQMQRGEGDGGGGGGQQRPTAQFPLRALRQINVSVSPLKLWSCSFYDNRDRGAIYIAGVYKNYKCS